MKQTLLFVVCSCLIISAGCSQTPSTANETKKTTPRVGGRCEGCEAIYENPVPFDKLTSSLTLPDYGEKGKKIKLTGTVYKADGKTPAPGVVIYMYHTDQGGEYSTRGNEKGWGKRHGYIRGWLKTGSDGRYTVYTLQPASYPNSRNPAHIHVTIKEPELNEYWIDDYLFMGDPFLEENKSTRPPHGGSGIITLKKEGDVWVGRRDIILGKNIPDYPRGS